MSKLLATTALVASLVASTTASAASLFVQGSTFTVTGSNTPGGVLGTNNATISDGSTSN